MNKDKRKAIIKILNSGWSAINISHSISIMLNQPEEDILRIINNCNWEQKAILIWFDYFKESKTNIKNYNDGSIF